MQSGISANRNLSTKITGYCMGVIAAVTYGLNPLFALPLYQDGMDTNSVLFFRYLIGIPIVALIALLSGIKLDISWRDAGRLSVLGFMMGFSSLSLFESYNLMEASIASTMLFIYPLLVAIIMAVKYKERITGTYILCMVLAAIGLTLLYNGKPGATLSAAGVAWVIGSALSYAIVLVGINRSSLASMPSIKISFYLLSFGFIIFIVAAIVKGHVVMPVTWKMACNVTALGLFPTALSLIFTAIAIHKIGSTPTALLGVFEPVTAVMCGVLVFNEILSVRDVTGLLLILVSATLVIAAGLRVKRRHNNNC